MSDTTESSSDGLSTTQDDIVKNLAPDAKSINALSQVAAHTDLCDNSSVHDVCCSSNLPSVSSTICDKDPHNTDSSSDSDSSSESEDSNSEASHSEAGHSVVETSDVTGISSKYSHMKSTSLDHDTKFAEFKQEVLDELAAVLAQVRAHKGESESTTHQPDKIDFEEIKHVVLANIKDDIAHVVEEVVHVEAEEAVT